MAEFLALLVLNLMLFMPIYAAVRAGLLSTCYSTLILLMHHWGRRKRNVLQQMLLIYFAHCLVTKNS